MNALDVSATVENPWDAHRIAEYLGASVSYVYKAAERGEIPCRRPGALLRFVPDQVRAWAEGAPAAVRRLPVGTSQANK